MSEPEMTNWGFVGAIRTGVRDLFPTRKTKSAMWGVVGLGVLITYMELMAALLFSSLITNLDEQSGIRTALALGGFLLTFAAIRGISYFQSVYRLTVFGKALRQISSASRAAESWRWPMAIALVGMMGQLARLFIVTLTVTIAAWRYGLLLTLCSAIAVLIVNRTGRQQYAIHHEFAEAKKAGNPPTAAERIGTRIRAGERAGLVAVGPILVYVAALGVGAASGRVTTQSALVLFIAGRMASNMYGSLSNASMRYIRAQVNVEAYGGSSPPPKGAAGVGVVVPDEQVLEKLSSGGYIWEPPAQAFARLVDDGYVIGDSATLGRISREAGFGPNRGVRKHAPAARPAKIVAVAPNQVWLHEAYAMPIAETTPAPHLQVVVDAFSRMIVGWRLDRQVADADVVGFFHEVCRNAGVAPEDVDVHTSAKVLGKPPNLQDFVKSLGVARTLLWTAPGTDEASSRPDRPPFPTRFGTSAEAKHWVTSFVTWHNEVFYHPDVGYLHPSDVHAGLADVITTKRQGILDAASGTESSPLPDAWLPPEEAWVEQVAVTTISRGATDSEALAFDEDEEL